MAASAANTSREIGAVAGTSILGALVFSTLNSRLNSQIAALSVPASERAQILGFKPIIIQVIETRQRHEVFDQWRAVLGAFAEPDGGHLGQRPDRQRAAAANALQRPSGANPRWRANSLNATGVVITVTPPASANPDSPLRND